MHKPYVVSADVQLLVREWARRRGFASPGNDLMNELRNDFDIFMRGIFPAFELVPEGEIADGLTALVARAGLSPLSLDRVYFSSASRLDITRYVDAGGRDRGLGHRPGTPPLFQQFKRIAESGIREAALVDDVIFTGELLERIIHCLSRVGVRVPIVCAGIGIEEGVRRINRTKREVRCVRIYEDVVDEICERDFYPGVPFAGRSLAGDGGFGVPYLLPFGNPGKWASIPREWEMRFSEFCIEQTIRLFAEIERRSNRIVACSDLDRAVVGLPRDSTRFIDALRFQ
ncbi:MAG: hypothetical protein AAB490_02915 [Patescibacteria group bacterium]